MSRFSTLMVVFGLVTVLCVLPSCNTCPLKMSKAPAATNVRLPALFTDNMVLQRDMKVPVWGWADPSGKVTVELGKQRVACLVGEDGKWVVHLRPMPAGGPYELKVIGAETITLKDVLIGDVWICSGQSNMQWPVKFGDAGVLNRDEEVANANYPNIRLFSVPLKRAFEPKENLEGAEPWKVCSPETVGPFSAVAYFFGRELHKHLNVPIGLIQTAWGGTVAEAWTSEASLRTIPDFVPQIDKLKEEVRQGEARIQQVTQQYQEQFKAWFQTLDEKDPGYANGQAVWASAKLKTADWAKVTIPDSSCFKDFDGTGWFRKTVTIPTAWAGKSLTLSLGPINDLDRVWFNGVQVGETTYGTPWRNPRVYGVPAELVKPGNAVITVRVLDIGGSGGLLGKAEQLTLSVAGGESISLAGEWLYHAGLDLKTVPPLPQRPALIENNPNLPSVLYNAMIAPLIPYGIRGAIWYQGESNANRAYQYRTLFPTLITDWRKQWGQGDFPFLFVQLANFQEVKPEPGDDAWAELREAQTMTLSLPNTGMAVTIDIGEANDIHPQNKQDVGKRLALAARHVAYGEELDYSGPLYKSMQVEGSSIRLYFDHVDGGLTTPNGEPLKGFAIAGEDKKFVWADAKIDGDTVVVSSPSVPNPVAVRYAWAINPVCNLYNRAGLPASPFRTDSWPGITVNNK
ncbi:MAG TPA: sialate O-acetylesterase [Candidatus Hydrogenedentes bacterium]|nr:sialate O-acetylesterase [Candidatus Hydrogenedentota bacterium]HOL78250.1 sialate O-acetylesterase [Candidatus Hydrogenedentota bacterium]HPO86390.1 sialate O-acetylesterase [Candidatus Hydrogenedentota bacterium]